VPTALLIWATLVGPDQTSLAEDYELAPLGASGLAPPAKLPSGGVTLFQNVRIFDGKSAALSAPANVLVRGELGWIA
jgi:hypothetical protein